MLMVLVQWCSGLVRVLPVARVMGIVIDDIVNVYPFSYLLTVDKVRPCETQCYHFHSSDVDIVIHQLTGNTALAKDLLILTNRGHLNYVTCLKNLCKR